jgi:hypothetical protein
VVALVEASPLDSEGDIPDGWVACYAMVCCASVIVLLFTTYSATELYVLLQSAVDPECKAKEKKEILDNYKFKYDQVRSFFKWSLRIFALSKVPMTMIRFWDNKLAQWMGPVGGVGIAGIVLVCASATLARGTGRTTRGQRGS